MRVRYWKAYSDNYIALCDLSERQAKALFDELSKTPTCEYAELVGEDDCNYMEILDYFDHTEQARKFVDIVKGLGGRIK